MNNRLKILAQRLRQTQYTQGEVYQTLNDEQRVAFDAMLDSALLGDEKLLLDSPTGSGKTVIFLSLIEALNTQTLPNEKPFKALIVVDTKMLLKQTLDEAKIFAPLLGADAEKIQYSQPKFKDGLSVMTYWTASKLATEQKIPNGFYDIVVKDEAHMSLSVKRQEAFDQKFPATTKVCFTATPEFYSGKGLQSAGYKLIYKLTPKRAVELGITCPVRNVILEFNDPELSLKNIKRDYKGEFIDTDLGQVINNQGVTKSFAHFYSTFTNPDTNKPLLGESGFFFCNDIEHAKAVAEQFSALIDPFLPEGVKACEPVWGVMGDKARDNAIENHQLGKTLFLASSDYLIQGYNHKKSGIAFNLRPTTSFVVAGQRGGRVTRHDPLNLSKVSMVVDAVYPNTPRGQILYSDFIGYPCVFKMDELENRSAEDILNPSYEEAFKPDNIHDYKLYFGERRVVEYISDRDLSAAGAKYSFIQNAPVPIARALLKQGYNKFEDFMEDIKFWAYQNSYIGDSREESDLHAVRELQAKKVKSLLQGGRGFVDSDYDIGELRQYTFTAVAISAVLKRKPVDLFGPLDAEMPLGMMRDLPDNACHHFYGDDFDHDTLIPDDISLSLDDGFYANEIRDSIGYLPDEHDILGNLQQKDLEKVTKQLLEGLEPRYERVLRMRFGMSASGEEETFQTIGDQMGVSKARAQQLESKALRTLKHPSRSARLRNNL